jgi:hypothetical protein
MDWSGLPLDVLIEIAVRLTVSDWLSFGVVCTAWKQAAETASQSGLRPKHEPPWLMLAGGGADLAVADFMSLSDGRRRSIALPKPAIQKRAWFGSANGWLVTVDDECALHLLNPITGAQLPLPSISTMDYFQVLPRDESNNAFRPGSPGLPVDICAPLAGARPGALAGVSGWSLRVSGLAFPSRCSSSSWSNFTPAGRPGRPVHACLDLTRWLT